MIPNVRLEHLTGDWTGSSRLWLGPDLFECNSTARVGQVGQGQFTTIAYAWEIEGEAQDGLIVFPSEIGDAPSPAAWLDSWHMKNRIMVCEAIGNEAGTVSLRGSYPAPPGPDWGWRIEVEGGPGPSLLIRMFNISPEGEETPAVLAEYRRAAPGPA
jgi:hypothetical protein